MRKPLLKIRYESFGGIMHLQNPPAQIFIDKGVMSKLGYRDSDLWASNNRHLSAPCEIHFSVTNKCPLNCPSCYVDGGIAHQGELTTAEIKRAIDLFAGVGVFQLAFGGGEPFAHRGLFDLAEYARAQGIVPNITTNGFYVTDELVKRCRVFGQVNVSLDESPGTDLGLRGAESVLVADKAIKLLKKYRLPVGINTVLSAVNFENLEKTAEYAHSNKIKDILLLRFKPMGRGLNNYDRMALRSEHLRELIPLTQRLGRAYKIKFRADCSLFPAVAYQGTKIDALDYWGVSGCDAGNNLVSVDPRGRFKACSFCFDEGGSVFDLKDAWETNTHLNQFRNWPEHAPEPCAFCAYLRLCKGGCHPIADVETGSFNNPDPACPIVADYRVGKAHFALKAKAGAGEHV